MSETVAMTGLQAIYVTFGGYVLAPLETEVLGLILVSICLKNNTLEIDHPSERIAGPGFQREVL